MMQVKRPTFMSVTRSIVGAALFACLLAAPARAEEIKAGDLVITQAWSRATPGGAKIGSGGLTIEPGKTVKLAPGGYHLMLLDLKTPLKQGDKVPVTLEFEKAGKVKLTLDVQGVGAQGPAAAGAGGHMDMKKMPDGMKM